MSDPDYTIKIFTTGLGHRIEVESRDGMTGHGQTVEGHPLAALLTDVAEAIKLDAQARREFAQMQGSRERLDKALRAVGYRTPPLG